MTWAKTTVSSAKRGYDTKTHKKLRAALLPQAYGTPCVRCGHPMLQGQALHLDHNDTRTGYLGFSHAQCNVRAAAKKARAIQVARAQVATLTGCPICGNTVPAGRTYCSQRCGYIANMDAPPKPKAVRLPKPPPPAPPPPRECVICGTTYISKRKYCSDECMLEFNARANRERYRERQGLPARWTKVAATSFMVAPRCRCRWR